MDEVAEPALDPEFMKGKLVVSRRTFYLLQCSLLFAILLATLDQILVSSALKSIVLDLSNDDLVSWIGSGYLIGLLPMLLAYSNFFDILGPRFALILALGIYDVGSLICGLAQSMQMLILGRIVSGLGGGGIISMYFLITPNIISFQDDILMYYETGSIFGGFTGWILGISAIAVPSLGGVFSDHVTWRLCFFMSIPVGFICKLIIYLFLYPFPQTTPESERLTMYTVDWFGMVLLVAAQCTLLSAIQLGGSINSPWKSPQVISLFIMTPLLICVFYLVETRSGTKDPIIPFAMMRNQGVIAICITALCAGAVTISGIYFIALFFQFNFNDSSLLAGVFIIPMLVGLFCAVVLAKWYISKYENHLIFYYFGPAILIGGLVLISLMDDQSSVTERIGNMFVFGFGGGIGAFARTKSAEGVLQPRTSKKLSALALGFVMLGSAISIAMTGTIVKNEILKSIDTLSPVYTDAVKILALQNITVDVVDIFVTINSFDIASLNAVQSGNNTLVEIFDTARMNVLVMFNSSFRIAFLWLIPFPVVMMLAAPWIPQETDSDSDITT